MLLWALLLLLDQDNPSSQQLYDQQCLTVKEGDGGMGFQVVVRWLLLLLLLLLLLYPCSLP